MGKHRLMLRLDYLSMLLLLLMLALPLGAEPSNDPVAETRQRLIGVWSPSRGYYNYKTGGSPAEMVEYTVTHRFNADGTWVSSDHRKGTWSVEEPNVLILDPKTLNERMFRLTFMGSEMARKGPYLRDGKLSRAGVTYTFYETIEAAESPER